MKEQRTIEIVTGDPLDYRRVALVDADSLAHAIRVFFATDLEGMGFPTFTGNVLTHVDTDGVHHTYVSRDLT